MHIEEMKIGQRVVWNRCPTAVNCTILDINPQINKVKLLIDGWLGTAWEHVDNEYRFSDIKKE